MIDLGARATLAGLLLMAAAACGGTQVDRIDPGTSVDLSGYWNDTDARLVAEEMIADAPGAVSSCSATVVSCPR